MVTTIHQDTIHKSQIINENSITYKSKTISFSSIKYWIDETLKQYEQPISWYNDDYRLVPLPIDKTNLKYVDVINLNQYSSSRFKAILTICDLNKLRFFASCLKDSNVTNQDFIVKYIFYKSKISTYTHAIVDIYSVTPKGHAFLDRVKKISNIYNMLRTD